MTTRYYILESDTTTAGGIVQKTTNTLSFKVYGKEQSYIGDDVWCPACQSMGKITPDQDRLSTKVNGRMPALNDDLCLCKCNLSTYACIFVYCCLHVCLPDPV